NVVRVGRARDKGVALLDVVAFLDVDHLGLGDQVLDRITLVRNDRDLALRLVVTDEFDPAADLGDDRVVLGNARFEQLRHPRQTAGDVAGLGRFARSTGENIAGFDLLSVIDRKRGTRSEHVTRRFGFLALVTGAFAKQGQARTQIFLLGTARRA